MALSYSCPVCARRQIVKVIDICRSRTRQFVHKDGRVCGVNYTPRQPRCFTVRRA